MSENTIINKKVLGIDVGSASLGWVLMDGSRVINCGVRIFEAGMEGDFEKGNEKSFNERRREMRLTRRRTDRLKRRLIKLANLLKNNKMFPDGDFEDNMSRHLLLNDLDMELKKKHSNHQNMPYHLRAKALDEKLELFEIGRVLYHLCQRRGFLSNRKSQEKEGEDPGKVKGDIQTLAEKISDTGSRTLGEYFSKADADERIRKQYTSRKMYEDEFNAIWDKQAEYYHEILTDELRKRIHKAIFHQRPIKFKKSSIGFCELEKNKRRAPKLFLDVQRFRMLQMVCNTRLIEGLNEPRKLTEEERTTLINALETTGDLTWSQAKKLLKLKSKDFSFNWEAGAEKRFLGNRTNATLLKHFGEERWNSFTADEKDYLVYDIHSIQKDEVLQKRLVEKWGLTVEEAKGLMGAKFEDEYASLSRKAIRTLLPRMEQGDDYSTIVKDIYGDIKPTVALDNLPPLLKTIKYISNPAVIRSLTELRKVVNTIIREYGKPDGINIEFLRELKSSKKRRKDTIKTIADNTKARDDARKRIIDKFPQMEKTLSNTDVLKVLLADECNWICPYTFASISLGDIVGSVPRFDIEHIIPFSQSLDNSFRNKTLCLAEENRNVKKNRSPYEAYSHTDKWEQIIAHVGRFKGRAARVKLRRFKMDKEQIKEEFQDFTSRHFTDSSYTAKLAQEYLSHLYGDEWRSRISVTSGHVTFFLRSEWKLNAILGEGDTDEKERSDHRHHMIDAITIAATNRRTIQMLSNASAKAEKYRRLFHKDFIEMPWESFFDDVKSAVDSVIVSHRVDRAVSGKLHAETFYGLGPDSDNDGKPDFYTITRPIDALKETEVKQVVDPLLKIMIEKRLQEADVPDNERIPAKVFQEKSNRPYFIKPDGKVIYVNSVKIKVRENPFQLREGDPTRYVMNELNHHAEVFEYKDKKGNVKWDGIIVPMIEACRRRQAGEPIIRRDHGDGRRLVFSLAGGDMIELDDDQGNRDYYVVRTISGSNVEFVKHTDARLKKDIQKAKDWKKRSFSKLLEYNCRKVYVDPIGRVRYSNT